MRVQSKTTASESQLSRAATVESAGQSFSEYLAQSSKPAPDGPVDIAPHRALANGESREANEGRQPSAPRWGNRQVSDTESYAKGSGNQMVSTQSMPVTRKQNMRQDQQATGVARDNAEEEQPRTRSAADHDEKSATPESARLTEQQNELMPIPVQPVTIELTACASTAAADADSISAVPTLDSVQAATVKNDAMQRATDAQQPLKGVSAQPEEASELAAADAQQAEIGVLLEEPRVGNLGMAVSLATLQPLASQASAQSQPRTGSDGNQQGDAVQVSTAHAQTYSGLTAAFDVSDLQASASAECSVSASTATSGNTDVTHLSVTANSSSDQDSVQTATVKNDAMQRVTDAQQPLKGASAQSEEASKLAAADAQQAEIGVLLEELGVGNLGMAADIATLQPPATQGSALLQKRIGGENESRQGSAVQGTSVLAQTSAGLPAVFDATNLQASESAEHSVSASAVTSGNTDASHSSSTANGAADQTGHRMLDSATPAETGAVHTEIVNVIQAAAVPQHNESRLVAGERAELAVTDITAQNISVARELMADQNNGSTLAGMSGISTVQLVQSMRDSEMRVGIHLNEFGAVSIRTTVSDQQMQAQIAVEHSELGSMLAAHIPSMQQKLGTEFGLQASIEVNANSSGSSGNGQHPSQHQTATPAMVRTPLQDFTTEIPVAQTTVTADSTYRLDIRA